MIRERGAVASQPRVSFAGDGRTEEEQLGSKEQCPIEYLNVILLAIAL